MREVEAVARELWRWCWVGEDPSFKYDAKHWFAAQWRRRVLREARRIIKILEEEKE